MRSMIRILAILILASSVPLAVSAQSLDSYMYAPDQLTTDIAAGWTLILVVDRSATVQTLTVYQDGAQIAQWPVSTALEDYKELPHSQRKVFVTTPLGRFQPFKMKERYHSLKWDIDMPDSIFFTPDMTGFHATKGAKSFAALGQRYSSGCIHLSPDHAKALFNLVHGHWQHTLVVIQDTSTAVAALPVAQ
jgi:lipoprotein-anchoring transpeptidase ErfK/SrfK